MSETDRSPPAKEFDDAYAAHAAGVSTAEAAARDLKKQRDEGVYAAHVSEALQGLLERYRSDPQLFLINVRGVGGASPEKLFTDGGRHGFDGSSLPQEDVQAFAAALTSRNTALEIMSLNWPKLTDDEKRSRSFPSGAPTT